MPGLLAAMVATPLHAQEAPPVGPQLTLKLTADPENALRRVSIWRNGNQIVLTEAPAGPARIELSPPLPETLWLVADWKGGHEFSAYPIVLVHSLAGQQAEVMFVKDPPTPPSNTAIQKQCGQSSVTSVPHAFQMYFTCKAAAVADPSDFGITRRAALQGWLKANLYLAKVMKPISPFAYDDDLAAALRDVLDRGGSERGWQPLRLADARDFINAYDARDMRLYPLIAELKDSGNLEAAMAVLNYVTAAYDRIVGKDGTQPVDRIDRTVLNNTRAYLETLMGAGVPGRG
ncbi:hypothetical protein [Ancylobacter sp. IITR112]|uniref:hypothetical protein n=1 Tax=Ancylobacter sp. IITR112 TaxID=3138073 RepID=UPI00352A281D